MQIEEIKTEALIPYQFNNKVHDITQVDRIANSIKEFGFIQPLVVDKNNVVVIGHGRLEAAKKLGLDTVPCLYVENLTDTQIKKLRILDNKLNESERDIPNLKLELDDLDNLNIGDIELEINDLFPELNENTDEEENDVEEVEEIEAQTAKIAGGGTYTSYELMFSIAGIVQKRKAYTSYYMGS